MNSLSPTLNLASFSSALISVAFRLARPSALIDLNGVEELAYIREGEGGGVWRSAR